LGSTFSFIALTGEVVVDYCLRFKKRYGFEETWVAGYTNELLSYIPSLRVLREGGYEGVEDMEEYGLPAPYGEELEERIAGAVEGLLVGMGVGAVSGRIEDWFVLPELCTGPPPGGLGCLGSFVAVARSSPPRLG
jgi:hypothetical protein